MRPFLFFMVAWGAVGTGMGVAAGAGPAPMEARAAEASASAPRVFASGPTRVALIELFTSEGCSSCPPAERWLGELREEKGLWRDFVPVAFHVNYWDRLGWPDRFASREATQRQYAHAAAWGTRSVYTPGFVRDGAEWRGAGSPPRPSREPAGALTLTVAADGSCRAEFLPVPAKASPRTDAAGAGDYEIHVALLGAGIVSRVKAGENRGETLRHDFVALALATHPLAVAAGNETAEAGAPGWRAEFTLPKPAVGDVPRRAVAAWVTRRGQLAPLQATGGWRE